MTRIIFLFAIGFLVQDVASDEGLLSKFHQNGYKIKDFRIQLLSYDHDVFNIFEIKTFKYNRTTTAHNFTGNLKVDVKDQIELLVQGYKFYSNEYRHFPIRFQVNLRKAGESNVVGMSIIKKCGNFSSFYLQKDVTYHICNFVPDEERFPPLIPNGRYKFDGTGLYLNKEVVWVSAFFEIYTPIKYPKK